MSSEYVSMKDAMRVIEEVEYCGADNDIALSKLIAILKRAHGVWKVENNKLIFVEDYDPMDYKYTTSVIGGEDQRWRVEQSAQLRTKQDKERWMINFFLEDINERLRTYEEEFLLLFFDRYFRGMSVRAITKKHKINNKKYYYIIEGAEHWFKVAFMIWTPPQALMDMIESD